MTARNLAKKLVPSLALAFALAGCGDNAQETAQKPALIDAMTRQSLAACETGPVNSEARDYRARLQAVFNDTRYRDLKTISDNKITVCLDQRLSTQDKSAFDRRIDGVFYQQRGGGIATLWDDGRPKSQAGFWTLDTYDYGSSGLEKLADAVRDGDTSKDGQLMYAARYTYSTGKSSYSVTKWRAAADFDKDSTRKNPDLQKPPLRKDRFAPQG